MMNIGTKIIWLATDPENPGQQRVRFGVITKTGKDTYYVNNEHRAEDQIYAAYCLPDRLITIAHLMAMVEHQQAEAEWNKKWMGDLYKLRNGLIKGGKL